MYINIHSHQRKKTTTEIISVESFYENFENVVENKFASVGIHPWFIEEEKFENQLKQIEQLIIDKKIIAIGECGLDKISSTNFDLQKEVFQQQLNLALKYQFPLIIHCVRAFDEIVSMTEIAIKKIPIIFHGYNKNEVLAKQLIEKGYYLSFGKSLFKNQNLKSIQSIPLEKLFLETDDDNRSIKEVYELAAKQLNISLETLILQIEKNFNSVFIHK